MNVCVRDSVVAFSPELCIEEAPNPSVMVLGGGAFEKYLGMVRPGVWAEPFMMGLVV